MALLVTCSVPAAYAQPAASPDAAKAAAQEAADRGQELYDAGKYEEAIIAFRDADKSFHAPTFVLRIAEAHDKLRRLNEARALYQQVVDEKLPPNAPKVFIEAQATAKKKLEALIPRIPTLQVKVTGAPVYEVRLSVDGRTWRIREALPLDPGEHTVTASVPGRKPVVRRLTVFEGGKAELMLDLAVPGSSKEGAAPEEGKPADIEKPPEGRRISPGTRTALIGVGIGLGGVGIGMGTMMTVLSFGKASARNDACGGGERADCEPEVWDDLEASRTTFANAALVAFVAGGLVLGGTAALAVFGPKAEKRASATVGVRMRADGPGVVVMGVW